MPDYRHILKSYWGYDDFRPMQREIIESVGAGRDTLGLLPTGGGKSITFQVPALTLPGLCLVITPLVALMKDQVEILRRKDIKAASIHSGMTYDEMQNIFNFCLYGNCKFLYISPERLSTPLFLEKLRHLTISLIAVDESHCISQWGYDFRPAYRRISDIRLLLPGVPVLALTATATPEVVTDIQRQLSFPAENVFKTSFARRNLIYVVRKTDDKEGQMLRILKAVPGSSVIYVRSRQKTREVAEFLNKNHIAAEYFHAGLNNFEKDRKQAEWKSDAVRVMVATNAFGMGIDKPDVRTVIHLDLPDCIEAYFQEAGRAGRDGKTAYGILLYNQKDITKAEKRIHDNFPPSDFIKVVYESLSCYYQVGVDSGEGCNFEFDLIDFCSKFHLPQLPSHHALKILSLSGYLNYTDEVQTSPRVRFIASRRELYDIDTDETEEEVVNGLLRSYSGLFTDYAFIDESRLAQRCLMTPRTLRDTLIRLSRRRLINYIPGKLTPYIAYVRDRVDTDRIHLNEEAFALRRERFVERIRAMEAYAQDSKHCRSRLLLRYFGETDSPACGRCDVCQQQREESARRNLAETIPALLEAGPKPMAELAAACRCAPTQLAEALRFLIDEGRVRVDRKNLVYLQA